MHCDVTSMIYAYCSKRNFSRKKQAHELLQKKLPTHNHTSRRDEIRRINTLTKTTIDRDKISEETFQDSKQAIEKSLLNLRLTKG